MVTVPDPEEKDRRDGAAGSAGQGDADTPADESPAAGAGPTGAADATATDAAFASIVAAWRDDADVPQWPADGDADVAERRREHRDTGTAAQVSDPADEEHFEPPEPPPLPVPRPRTLLGVLMLAVGVLLLVRPNLLMVGESLGTPLGLLVFTAGIGWLVLGLRSGPQQPEGWDDGARL